MIELHLSEGTNQGHPRDRLIQGPDTDQSQDNPTSL